MYPRQISLLSCCQIPMPLPLILQSHVKAVQSTHNKDVSSALQTNLSSDDTIAGIWSPQRPAERTEPRRAFMDRDIDSDVLNVWLCPEVGAQIRRERARRRKALMIAERMGALVQAGKQHEIEQQQKEREARRGRKRKAGDGRQVDVPTSPELARPQLLLMPELLPKGMLKTQVPGADITVKNKHVALEPELTQSHADTNMTAKDTHVDLEPVLSQSHSDSRGSSQLFDLGLDLGFDIAQAPSPCERHNDTRTAILEITDFLEKDVDIFTPTSMVFGSRGGRIDMDVLPVSKDRQHDLIEDILNFSL
ncbi:hypothetical protein LPJ69_003226 [Coemansia sp. RSA 1752]|nr:hypothetical protein LPJ69_003226 [Coemansia sp. RSA 1752]KAJ1787819.1 hypothetical protein LPJ67_003065 [Coemansia sp. RSA 1938]